MKKEFGPVEEWWYNTGNLFSHEVSMIERIAQAQELIESILQEDEESRDLVTYRLRRHLEAALTSLQNAADVADELHAETSEDIRSHLVLRGKMNRE